MKIGDRVICIDASNKNPKWHTPRLIKGREYIIYDVQKCSCGIISFDVGLINQTELIGCGCGRIYRSNNSWCLSTRFAKVQEKYRVVHLEVEIEEPILN